MSFNQESNQVSVRVDIIRLVDESNPGWVECRLVDAHGKTWLFREKAPVVCGEYLDTSSSYPQKGSVACRVLSRSRKPDGQEIVSVDTSETWGIESTEGVTEFDVLVDQLIQ